MGNIVVENVGRSSFMNIIWFCISNENIRSFKIQFDFLYFLSFLVPSLFR